MKGVSVSVRGVNKAIAEMKYEHFVLPRGRWPNARTTVSKVTAMEVRSVLLGNFLRSVKESDQAVYSITTRDCGGGPMLFSPAVFFVVVILLRCKTKNKQTNSLSVVSVKVAIL